MNRIVVLGCGAVGRHIAIDLCKAPDCMVVSVDVDEGALEQLAREHPIETRVQDLSTVEGFTRAVEDADLVIGSLPYSIGYAMPKVSMGDHPGSAVFDTAGLDCTHTVHTVLGSIHQQ